MGPAERSARRGRAVDDGGSGIIHQEMPKAIKEADARLSTVGQPPVVGEEMPPRYQEVKSGDIP